MLKQGFIKFTCAIVSVLACSVAWSASYEFTIDQGSVTVTASFCPPENCYSQTGVIRGNFVADISGEKILFSDTLIKSEVSGFELPEDPNLDSGGTTRTASFDFDGTQLTLKGVVDSRAFDGPVYEYSLVATTRSKPEFDPKGFYRARQDFRKCVSPMCGGIYVSKLNRYSMRCPNGKRARECYIGNVDWQDLGGSVFDGDETLVLQGDIKEGKDEISSWGTFVVTTALRAAGDKKARGLFVGIENNGIVCITSPCFSYDQYLLNSRWTTTLSGLNLDRAGADKKAVEEAYNVIGSGGVLIAQGYNYRTREMTGRGKVFAATQFYLPIEVEPVITLCPVGYIETDMGCATRHGCFYPDLELSTIGGAAMEDPETGELVANIQYSCVAKCEAPAEMQSEGYCTLALP
jgi:hypothetical protein